MSYDNLCTQQYGKECGSKYQAHLRECPSTSLGLDSCSCNLPSCYFARKDLGRILVLRCLLIQFFLPSLCVSSFVRQVEALLVTDLLELVNLSLNLRTLPTRTNSMMEHWQYDSSHSIYAIYFATVGGKNMMVYIFTTLLKNVQRHTEIRYAKNQWQTDESNVNSGKIGHLILVDRTYISNCPHYSLIGTFEY